jgi:hypothetical protein
MGIWDIYVFQFPGFHHGEIETKQPNVANSPRAEAASALARPAVGALDGFGMDGKNSELVGYDFPELILTRMMCVLYF